MTEHHITITNHIVGNHLWRMSEYTWYTGKNKVIKWSIVWFSIKYLDSYIEYTALLIHEVYKALTMVPYSRW